MGSTDGIERNHRTDVEERHGISGNEGVSAGESRASCVPGVSKSVYWSRMVSKIRFKSDSRVYQSANGSVDSSCRVFPCKGMSESDRVM